MSSQRINRKMAKALPWAVAESAFSLLIGLFSITIIGVLVTPDALGLAGAALATAAVVELACSGGMQDTVIRARSADTRTTDTAFTLSLFWAAVSVATCIGAAYSLSYIYGVPTLMPMTAVASIIGAANTISSVPMALLIRKMRAGAMTRRMILGQVAGVCSMFGFAFWGLGAWAVILGSVISAVTMALSVVLASSRLPRPRFDAKQLRDHFTFGLAVGVENFVWGLTVRCFALAFGYFYGVAALGLFQFSMKLVNETANLIQTAANRFGLAYFSAIRRNGDDLATALLSGTRLLCMIAFPALLLLTILGGRVVAAVFPARWEGAGPYIQIVSAGWLLVFPRLFITPVMRSAGYQTRLVFNAFMTLLIALAALTMVSDMDPLWGVIAWSARQAYSLAWFSIQLTHTERISVRKQIAAMARPVLAAALFSTWLIISLRLTLEARGGLYTVAFSASMGLFLYLFGILAVESQLRARLFQLIRPEHGIADRSVE